MSSDSYDHHVVREREDKANALRQRQLQDQQNLSMLPARADHITQPAVIRSQGQSVQRIPVHIIQQAPTTPVQRPAPVSTNTYVPKIQKPRATDIITGFPIKKWPTSFKKAFHKSTPDEKIMGGVNNLDHMAKKLLGR